MVGFDQGRGVDDGKTLLLLAWLPDGHPWPVRVDGGRTLLLTARLV